MDHDNDPFSLDEDTDEGTEEQVEPKTNNQLQAAQRKLAKAEKELEELRTFREQREKADRTLAVSETFKSLGLQPDWAEFYQGEDAGPDAVKAWALEKKFLAPAEEGEESPEPEPQTASGFTPTVIEGGSALGTKFYSFEEYEQVRKTDPAKADQIRKANRVQKEAPSWTVLEG